MIGARRSSMTIKVAVRKTLLAELHLQRIVSLPYNFVRQGYIFSDDEGEVRIRSSWSGAGTVYTLTAKDSGGLSRSEVENQISAEMFSFLWPRCRGSCEKLRFKYSNAATVDVFTSPGLQGLVLAQMEFPRHLASFMVEVMWPNAFEDNSLALKGLPSEELVGMSRKHYLNNWEAIGSRFTQLIPT